MKNVNDIRCPEAEAAIIATAIKHPEFTFFSDNLEPGYFTDTINQYMYSAIRGLTQQGVTHIDDFNILSFLNAQHITDKSIEKIVTLEAIKGIIDTSDYIARNTAEEYMVQVNAVMRAANRRELFKQLVSCENLCFSDKEDDISGQIYNMLDKTMLQFSNTSEIPTFAQAVDSLYQQMIDKQDPSKAGIPFKFEHLNQYVTIERGELIIFAADAKQGKSMMLMNCCADLLKSGKKVLYIDSELSSLQFFTRLLAHFTRIEYKKIRAGIYDKEEKALIERAKEWFKSLPLTHIYLPLFDEHSIYTVVKKVAHTQGIDVLIVDYFKGNNGKEAFEIYAELGHLVDMVKNTIAGQMDIASLGAVQATTTGKIADSAKIARNASTIILLENKSPEEIEHDGRNCGNKKMRVVYNRNGEQMAPDEYIDLQFNGNLISYEEAEQHTSLEPF